MLIETVALFFANLPIRSRYLDRRRWHLLRMAGVNAKPCDIMAPVNLAPFGHLKWIHIGANTFINSGLRIGASIDAPVEIGENCAIGPNVSFEATGHDLVWRTETGWGMKVGKISVGDRCWIGAGSIILANVTIGNGVVVAAGSVVTRDVEPYCVVAGVPAKLVKRLAPPPEL